MGVMVVRGRMIETCSELLDMRLLVFSALKNFQAFFFFWEEKTSPKQRDLHWRDMRTGQS